MIDIAALTEADKGREVRYATVYAAMEYGKITSWNDEFIFVRYHLRIMANGDRQPRYGETSEGTRPETLTFTDEEDI